MQNAVVNLQGNNRVEALTYQGDGTTLRKNLSPKCSHELSLADTEGHQL